MSYESLPIYPGEYFLLQRRYALYFLLQRRYALSLVINERVGDQVLFTLLYPDGTSVDSAISVHRFAEELYRGECLHVERDFL